MLGTTSKRKQLTAEGHRILVQKMVGVDWEPRQDPMVQTVQETADDSGHANDRNAWLLKVYRSH